MSPFYGIRKSESVSRSKYNRVEDDAESVKIQQQTVASPIFFWKDANIWLYMFSENVDFNDAYRLGYDRVGCWCCPNNTQRAQFLSRIYMPDESQKWRTFLIDFAKKIGKEDAEVYVDTGKWKARQGGNGLRAAGDVKIRFTRNIMQYNNTLGYYDSHADEFYKSTVNIEFITMQERFLARLKKSSYILDFGCGSGRDTKYFMDNGYYVDAIDGSKELCKLASECTGIEVKNMYFEELSEVEKYDGIWACSSILHLSVVELTKVMQKMAVALKENGIIYTSFKYGTFSGERNGRFFTDMTEETFADFLSEIDNLEIEEQWTTSDVRPGRGEEKWLNLILRKR